MSVLRAENIETIVVRTILVCCHRVYVVPKGNGQRQSRRNAQLSEDIHPDFTSEEEEEVTRVGVRTSRTIDNVLIPAAENEASW